ncbi:MAG: Sapep family Mn(2+)-dependent dipeptidase [Clostridiales bacterium]|jgi:acetylornithine deacetylase/succinyl-diaminopimelate desuccinylase-like protein|nr:Sapep family Mn(2+)-dependent dipeptidase [Clostridiales bacterium]
MKKYLGEMISSLQKLISFNSVAGKKTAGAPFGKAVGQALGFTLALSKSLGFSVKNLDGFSGYAETGLKDGKVFAVLCHLDVVPFNRADWKHDPLGGEIDGGKLYGRGALDDKGPTVAALYAVKKLLDEGFEFHKKVRFIFGLDEEGGKWKSMDYYLEKEGMPEIGIAPDADFPVINSEMGKVNFVLKMKIPKDCKVVEFGAGTRPNIVPDSAYFIARNENGLEDAAKKCGLTVEKIYKADKDAGRNFLTKSFLHAPSSKTFNENPRIYTADSSQNINAESCGNTQVENAENGEKTQVYTANLCEKTNIEYCKNAQGETVGNIEKTQVYTANLGEKTNIEYCGNTQGKNAKNGEKTQYYTAENIEFLKISAVGKAAHGAHPEQGENAAVTLLKFLNSRGIEPFFSLYTLLSDYNGNGLGIAFKDEISGRLTMNAGVFKTSKDGGVLSVELDVRYPHCVTKEELFQILKKDKRFTVKTASFHRPLYVKESDPLVAKLLKAYNGVTGENASAVSIGGATFARALDYGVAFGPVFPGTVSTIHEADENIGIDDFLKTAEIYYEAFKSLL